MQTESYTYIIVGAGSAGCVLANRLSEDPKTRVLLIEAGGSDKSIFIKMPSALSYPMNTDKYNWRFESVPEPYMNNREIHCPRGKVLGGSSSINGMVYVRGHACDFDEWEEEGATGWNYQNCLPYFKRSEDWNGTASAYRGVNGYLGTQSGPFLNSNPLYEAFINAGHDAGYSKTDDYNGYKQEGFGPMHMTVKGGVRDSTSRAFLDPIKRRENLTIISKAHVHKVLLEDKKAVGVEFSRKGKVKTALATKEVILSAGAIGSPVLLQLSGIGPKEVLEKAGVEPVHVLPGVGENLQDHLEIYFQYECKQPITLNGKLGLVSKGLIGTRWILFKDGLGSTNHFESCAFIRSSAGQQWPDIQYHFLPAAMSYDGNVAFKGHGFQLHVGPNKPKSRGHVQIMSNDPFVKPKILFNYLKEQKDVDDWRACIRLSREIIAQPSMDPFRGAEIQPGIDVQSDDEIDAWIRENVESAYHPSCTCKIGSDDDPMAVLDAECRVRGIQGLRVVDSSVFPTITNGNLNAPTIMVAERAADIILGHGMLKAPATSSWIDPQWRDRQREGEPVR